MEDFLSALWLFYGRNPAPALLIPLRVYLFLFAKRGRLAAVKYPTVRDAKTGGFLTGGAGGGERGGTEVSCNGRRGGNRARGANLAARPRNNAVDISLHGYTLEVC